MSIPLGNGPSIMFVLESFFWAIIILAVATYLLYPACMWVVGLSASTKSAVPPEVWPSVSIVVAAYNEESVIGQKLKTILASDYAGPIEVLVADDGSNDNTAQVARAVNDAVSVYTYDRLGKAAALNQTVPHADGDLLVFTDADPEWLPSTLAELVKPFADEKVGSVAGNVQTRRSGKKHETAERGFRAYENAIRKGEERLFGCISADGALYAIRRTLFAEIPAGVTDDFFVSTSAVRAGQRIVFAPKAIVIEDSIDSESKHFWRRVRITVRGLTGLWLQRDLLNPFASGPYAIGLLFHKVLRRLAPVGLAALIPLSMILAMLDASYAPFAVAALAMLAIGGLPLLVDRAWPKWILMPHLLLNHLAGLSWGCVLFLGGRRYTLWTPQKMPIEAAEQQQ